MQTCVVLCGFICVYVGECVTLSNYSEFIMLIRLIGGFGLLFLCACASDEAAKEPQRLAALICDCAEVKEHLRIVADFNASNDSTERARLKAAVPASAIAMDKGCLGEFRRSAAESVDKKIYQNHYARALHLRCPDIARQLHVAKPTD